MKKLAHIIILAIAFASFASAQNNKLDSYLNQRVATGSGGDRVRAIVQFIPGNQQSVSTDVDANGGNLRRGYKQFSGMAIEGPLSAFKGFLNNPNVIRISYYAPTPAAGDI